jgi:hypothetical protein
MSRWTEKIELLRLALRIGVGSDVTVATPTIATREYRRNLRERDSSNAMAYKCAKTLPNNSLVSGPATWSKANRVQSAASIVTRRYVNSFTDISSARPDNVSDERWQQVHADARTFLSEWGTVADALEWPAEELFGGAAAGAHGLVWELRGRRVLAITYDLIAIDGNTAGCRAWFRRLRRF